MITSLKITALNNELYELEQARMGLRRVRDILDSLKASKEAELQDIHNSPEYQDSIRRQLLGEKQ